MDFFCNMAGGLGLFDSEKFAIRVDGGPPITLKGEVLTGQAKSAFGDVCGNMSGIVPTIVYSHTIGDKFTNLTVYSSGTIRAPDVFLIAIWVPGLKPGKFGNINCVEREVVIGRPAELSCAAEASKATLCVVKVPAPLLWSSAGEHFEKFAGDLVDGWRRISMQHICDAVAARSLSENEKIQTGQMNKIMQDLHGRVKSSALDNDFESAFKCLSIAN